MRQDNDLFAEAIEKEERVGYYGEISPKVKAMFGIKSATPFAGKGFGFTKLEFWKADHGYAKSELVFVGSELAFMVFNKPFLVNHDEKYTDRKDKALSFVHFLPTTAKGINIAAMSEAMKIGMKYLAVLNFSFIPKMLAVGPGYCQPVRPMSMFKLIDPEYKENTERYLAVAKRYMDLEKQLSPEAKAKWYQLLICC